MVLHLVTLTELPLFNLRLLPSSQLTQLSWIRDRHLIHHNRWPKDFGGMSNQIPCFIQSYYSYSRQIAPAAEKGGVKIVKILDAEVTEPTYVVVSQDMSLWPKDFRNHTITQTQSCTSLSIFWYDWWKRNDDNWRQISSAQKVVADDAAIKAKVAILRAVF